MVKKLQDAFDGSIDDYLHFDLGHSILFSTSSVCFCSVRLMSSKFFKSSSSFCMTANILLSFGVFVTVSFDMSDIPLSGVHGGYVSRMLGESVWRLLGEQSNTSLISLSISISDNSIGSLNCLDNSLDMSDEMEYLIVSSKLLSIAGLDSNNPSKGRNIHWVMFRLNRVD